MLNVVTKILCAFIMNTSGFLIVRNLIKDKSVKFDSKTLLIILLGSMSSSLFIFSEYEIITPLLSYMEMTVIYSLIFNIRISKSIILSGMAMILMFISELILLPIAFIFFSNDQTVRTIPIIMIGTNIVVGTGAILISKLKIVTNIYRKLIERLESIKLTKIIIFITLTVIALSIIFTIIANIYRLTGETIICFVTVVIFAFLFTLYSKEQNEYTSLTEQYNQLFECVREFEIWIDKNEKNNHEYKNDLAVLEAKISDPEIKKFIEEKLTQKMIVNSEWIHPLKDMPNGGMKGLIYYKIILAKNNKVELKIDISKQSKKHLKKLTEKEYDAICQLLGIYLDNALDAARNSKQRSMALEFYEMREELNIVITNSFKGQIELDKIQNKGYTTKGNGHGKGLSYANEILKENETLSAQNKICNNYYIQRIIVHNKKSH